MHPTSAEIAGRLHLPSPLTLFDRISTTCVSFDVIVSAVKSSHRAALALPMAYTSVLPVTVLLADPASSLLDHTDLSTAPLTTFQFSAVRLHCRCAVVLSP